MSGTTSRTAIDEMVTAKFGDKHIDKMVGQPTSMSI